MSQVDEDVDLQREFADELKPGTELMFGQYTIDRFLAAGGFGITYLATNSLNRQVVIKECFPGNFCRRKNRSVRPRSRGHQDELASIVQLFTQEALSLSKVIHKNVVGVHQVFGENNTAYMALDYVEGRDLLEIVSKEPESLDKDEIQSFLIKMIDAIGHVHESGILHRDISPDNILIGKDREPVLIDFGAAREDAGEKASRLLSALRVVKDGYSPQEYYIAGSDQNASCDLYSLAASFYHVITGEIPPDSQSRLSAFAAGEPDPYVPLAERAKDYPKPFTTALDKAISVLPKDRMQSAEEWKAYISGEIEVADVLPQRAAKVQSLTAGKPRVMPFIIGATAIAAIAGVATFFDARSGTLDVGTETAVDQATSVDTAIATPVPEEIPLVPPSGVDVEERLPSVDVVRPEPSETPPAVVLVPVAPREPNPSASAPDAGVEENTFSFETATNVPSPRNEAQQTDVDVNGPKGSDELVARTSNPDAEIVASSIVEHLVPVVPFTLSPEQPGVVDTVAEGTPFWLVPGVQIVTVNGADTTTNFEIMASIQAHPLGGSERAELTLGLAGRLTDGAIERTLETGIERRTLLTNGLFFLTTTEDGVSRTTVGGAPDTSNFRPGDKLVAYMRTGQEMDGTVTVKDLLESELAAGFTTFNFAVERDGELWVEAFDLESEPGASAPQSTGE